MSDWALSADVAISRAALAAGCDDFGADGLREGLERTLDAFARLPLTAEAGAAAMAKVVHDLTNRLRIEQYYADHPEVAEERIEGPVLVCGLPRTGTTATVGMLATDPRFRFLRGWEANAPVPPPVEGEEDLDPRVLAARDMAAKMASHQSRHIMDPDGPEEDLAMLAPLNMRGYHGAYPMPDDYIGWWSDTDFASTYAYNRRVMQLLQSRRGPKFWLIKAPIHLFKLQAFAAAFPTAKFVWTHRDPAKVIPSVSSLQYGLNEQRCEPGALDKLSYGRKFISFWTNGVARALESRERIGDERFVDVRNDDVAARPIETFEKLYDQLGFEFTDSIRAGLEDYSRRNARGAFGEHRYTAEEFGTSRGEIRNAFAFYTERFGL